MPLSSDSGCTTAAQFESRWIAFDTALALAEFTLDGQLIFANPKYQALLQLLPEQFGSLQHAQLCPAALVQCAAYAAMWQSLCAGNEFSGVVERVRRDGSHCWLQAVYAPARDKQGVVTHILMAATDVSQSQQAELGRQDQQCYVSRVTDITDAAIVITNANAQIDPTSLPAYQAVAEYLMQGHAK